MFSKGMKVTREKIPQPVPARGPAAFAHSVVKAKQERPGIWDACRAFGGDRGKVASIDSAH